MRTSNSTIPKRGTTAGWPKMRPRFVVDVDAGAEDVMDALREAAQATTTPVEAELAARHGVVTVPAAERAFWSTYLTLRVEEADPSEREEASAT